MIVWVFLNGQQQGPFTMEELLDMPVDENTKVWFEGLPKWYPAGCLNEMKPLFDGSLAARVAASGHAAPAAADSHAPTDASRFEASEVREAEEATEVAEKVAAEEGREVAEAAPQPRYAPGRRYVAAAHPDEPCPPTYLGWTVFLTICCCSPVSIAGLIASICVTSYYNGGKLDRARKASEVTAWLVMIAIALGMIPVMLMSALFGE